MDNHYDVLGIIIGFIAIVIVVFIPYHFIKESSIAAVEAKNEIRLKYLKYKRRSRNKD